MKKVKKGFIILLSMAVTLPVFSMQKQNRADATEINQEWAFGYTGSNQTFTVPDMGVYVLEAWGAQGGSDALEGGKGGYAKGEIVLNKGERIQVNVGGSGGTSVTASGGGWNGGGNAGTYGASGGGGGATDFRFGGVWLQNRILVAGGGGGGSATSMGGTGGGFIGSPGQNGSGIGGSQSAGGAGSEPGTLGKGGDKTPYDNDDDGVFAINESDGGGGGGGYYGGGAGYVDNINGSGGGGSSYIGSVGGGVTIAGDAVMPTPFGTTSIGRSGAGYAKITLKEKKTETEGTTWNYGYSGTYETFIAPHSGNYQMTAWGAKGGDDSGVGGKGGYATGEVALDKGEIVYIYVGGKGATSVQSTGGGWNGGGNAGPYGSSGGGGGATDFRLKTHNLNQRILVAGGGGGAGAGTESNAGHGGGLIGTSAANAGGAGATQIGGGVGGGSGSFGKGGDKVPHDENSNGIFENSESDGGGGGGGYYGGGAGFVDGVNGGGGGGSSYIGGVASGTTIAGDMSMPNPSGGTMTGNAGDGYAQVTLLQKTEEAREGERWRYPFSGSYRIFTVPHSGNYQLETWGAKGGDDSGVGGKGGYAKGDVFLTKGEKLFIYVGKKGENSAMYGSGGGWNGGGNVGQYGSSGGGGGATDIRKNSDKLNDRVLVAGGGGGGSATSIGGAGGGLVGFDGANNSGGGGTQSAGGGGSEPGTLGKGGDKIPYDNDNDGLFATYESDGGGGGGGYYGGGAGYVDSINGSGGGGSSYIGGVSNVSTINGNTTMPSPMNGVMIGNEENGYAIITFVENYEEETIHDWNYDYTGEAQTFIAPHTGHYRLETWGAQGATIYDGVAGKGGYARGKIFLNKGDRLHVYVGGHEQTGGWNGGGKAEEMSSAGGGGATDIRLIHSTDPLNLSSLRSRILVAGGGGGAERVLGGAGGGLVGQSGQPYLNYTTSVATGGTQNAGGDGALDVLYGRAEAGGFGYGGSSVLSMGVVEVAAGGGGGYYGGGAVTYAGGAGGGSSYIDGVLEGHTISGDLSMPNPLGDSIVGKSGSGYAKIALLEYVDTEQPIGLLSQNPTSFTNQDVIITATGTDSDSGFKYIILPNGLIVADGVATYTVSANGNYEFMFVDNAGNMFVEQITIGNIDKNKPTVVFTPDTIEGSYQNLSVQIEIEDTGVSGYKQFRYVWKNANTYPTTGWSDWEATENPIITQKEIGKWYLHVEVKDRAGNIAYAMSGIYEKLLVSGGPSVNLNVFPTPTGMWVNKPIDVYILESGDSELLAKATKRYAVTNSSLYPTDFNQVIPFDKKVQLNLVGENFIHVQYILDDGTKISSTTGPYLIDTGAVGDFEMKLTNASGNEVNDWGNESLRLVITDPTNVSISGYQKQYRIEGFHHDWQSYQEGMTIHLEGEHRIFGRIVTGTGRINEQRMVISAIDRTKPTVTKLIIEEKEDGLYDISVKATDALSGIKEVILSDGSIMKKEGSSFVLRGVSAKPDDVVILDQAGNQISVGVEQMPTVVFESPYDVNAEVYRNQVNAVLTNATNYQFGHQSIDCSSETCRVTIEQNGTLKVRNVNGIKESVKTFTIDNIDRTELRLLLSGKRENNNPYLITFKWNYSLNNATLTCIEGGSENSYTVSGKSKVISAQNFTYDCVLSGNYGGESIVSNHVMINPTATAPIEEGTDVDGTNLSVNVYVKESMIGKTYLINTRSKNTDGDYVPIPKNEITDN